MKSNSQQHSFLHFVLIGVLLLSFMSCEKTGADDSGSGGNGSGSGYKGTWVRLVGNSGDETDIAIGSISGESENRVYMCEWRGAVGLYKGYITGNIIKWDASYRLPDAEVGLKDGKLSFVYPSVSSSLKTYYDKGSWSSRCGPLANGGGSTSTPTVRPKGQFKIVVKRPTGSCASANTSTYPSAWVAGTVVSNTFDQSGQECCSIRVINQGRGPAFNNSNDSWTYTSLSGVSKLYWQFHPDKSTWPSNCTQEGSAVIEFEGQVKTIVIW
jgi:hypothetical protein